MKVPGCVLDIEDASSADFKESSRYKSQKTLRRPVYGSLYALNSLSFTLNLLALTSYLYLFITRRLLKLKVIIYRFVLLNFNKVMRP